MADPRFLAVGLRSVLYEPYGFTKSDGRVIIAYKDKPTISIAVAVHDGKMNFITFPMSDRASEVIRDVALQEAVAYLRDVEDIASMSSPLKDG
jgi:hypothetical protein